MRQITDTMRQAWARDPVTQEFLGGLRESKQETMELWAREAYVAEKPENTLQANAKALGGVALLDKLIVGIEGLMESDEHNSEVPA
jgi:hypothetical protein